MHEGVLGRFESQIDDWLSCPSVDEASSRPYPPTEKFQQLPLSNNLRLSGKLNTEGRTPPPGLPPTDDSIICPYAWSAPLHALNCEIIWPLELDVLPSNTSDSDADLTTTDTYLELDTPEYAGAIKDAWLVEKLLAMGGIRLAAVLNYLFVTEGESMVPLYLAN